MHTVFFRNDDVGALDASIVRLIELFEKHGVPLSLAVVPTHATAELADHLSSVPENLLEVHQHGYAHNNYPEKGLFRGEFGANRTRAEKEHDLTKGFAILSKLFGARAIKIFTPPWNAMDTETYALLQKNTYLGFSMQRPRGFTNTLIRFFRFPFILGTSVSDLSISIDAVKDWKEKKSKTSAELWNELRDSSFQKKPVGIMLHDKIMDDEAFAFLDAFITLLKQENIPIVCMSTCV